MYKDDAYLTIIVQNVFHQYMYKSKHMSFKMHIMTSPYFTERHILKEKHKYLTHRFNIT